MYMLLTISKITCVYVCVCICLDYQQDELDGYVT